MLTFTLKLRNNSEVQSLYGKQFYILLIICQLSHHLERRGSRVNSLATKSQLKQIWAESLWQRPVREAECVLREWGWAAAGVCWCGCGATNISDKGKLWSARDNMHEEFCNSANLIWAWRNNLFEINSCAPNQHHKRIRSWIKWGKENLSQFWNGCQNSKWEFHHINGYQRLSGMNVKTSKISG